MDFAAVLNTNINGVVVPTGYNGHATSLDISAPADHIHPDNKIVISVNNTYSLLHTLAHHIFIAAGSPANALVVTPNVMNSAIEAIGNVLVAHTLLTAFHACGIVITLRSADVMTEDSFNALVGNNLVPLIDAATRIYTYLTLNPENMARACHNSKFVALALIASALHRASCNGHNWLTRDTRKHSTVTGRITAIAADERDAFMDFMERSGHDMWHMLKGDSLAAAASALTGATPTNFNQPFVYLDIDVQGSALHNVIIVGEAASDRWPPGVMGKSSLIVGIDLAIMMLQEIASKFDIPAITGLIRGLRMIRAHVSDTVNLREDILTLKDRVGNIIAVAYGFCSECSHLEDFANKSPALKNFVGTIQTAVASGTTIAKRFKAYSIDPHAFATVLSAMLGAATDAINTSAVAGVAELGLEAPLVDQLPPIASV